MAARISKHDKIINAALGLAASRSWDRISMVEIAGEAGLSLADARQEFSSLNAVILSYFDRVDTQMLAGLDAVDPLESRRDRVFDIVMRRFDVLNGDKAAVRSMVRAMSSEPALALVAWPRLMRTQLWVLDAAGSDTHGTGGLVKAKAMALVYANVFRVWLREDDPGMPRTMAELDRSLRRAERWARRLDRPLGVLREFRDMGATLARARRRRRKGDDRHAEPGESGALGEA